ncbi:VOC family protein [Paenarthrobacter sp. Z7-10]|uniref:VOC family protein n=1 Tax=Paenarthrobacter sp. Z7-10 TaxID=2787635 RepID=UPI0022A9EECD|nr:VOC family protein [Paenarthrobacter sp. Z7-10]MCZ2401758.1 VOC family protein [Paenarthrobacter sp. Z7-10]
MSYSIQMCVDSKNPQEQADWWAETLGWALEPSDEAFIRSMIEQGYATESETMVHNGVLVWTDGAAICPTEEVGQRGRRRILFQSAPEGKTVKNRVHWDVDLAGDDKDEVRKRLEGRGATFLWEANQGPHFWYTMADPEGNEFCLS